MQNKGSGNDYSAGSRYKRRGISPMNVISQAVDVQKKMFGMPKDIVQAAGNAVVSPYKVLAQMMAKKKKK